VTDTRLGRYWKYFVESLIIVEQSLYVRIVELSDVDVFGPFYVVSRVDWH